MLTLHVMVIAGVDPGLAHCGVAILTTESLAWPTEEQRKRMLPQHRFRIRHLSVYETAIRIKANKRKGIVAQDFTIGDRLIEHTRDLTKALEGVDLVAVEYPSFPRRAKSAAMLFASFATIIAVAGDRLVTFATPTMRRALGLSAREEKSDRKADVAEEMEARWGASKWLDDLNGEDYEHALDALAVASAWISAPELGKTASERGRRNEEDEEEV